MFHTPVIISGAVPALTVLFNWDACQQH